MQFKNYVNKVKSKQYDRAYSADLMENRATYKQMTAGLLQVYTKYFPDSADWPQQRFSNAIRMYGRADRIVWALRWERLMILDSLKATIHGNSDIDDDTRQQLKDALLKGPVVVR